MAFGGGFDLVVLNVGEFNVFRPADARSTLARAWQALVDGGWLLLEIRTIETVRRLGPASLSLQTAARGRLSNCPPASAGRACLECGTACRYRSL